MMTQTTATVTLCKKLFKNQRGGLYLPLFKKKSPLSFAAGNTYAERKTKKWCGDDVDDRDNYGGVSNRYIFQADKELKR